MSSETAASDQVDGERGETLVHRATSMQSRLSNILALSLMSVLGLGSLAWYYANSISRQSRARQTMKMVAASHAEGDAALPSLGRIDPPAIMLPPASDGATTADPPADGAAPAAGALAEAPLALSSAANAYPPPPTPQQIAQQRQLSGSVFSNGSAIQGDGAVLTSAQPTSFSPLAGQAPPSATGPSGNSSAGGDLSALLRPSVTNS